MISRFFIYGFIGWYIEIFWTAFGSFTKKDYRLLGTTSVWMFFIYGCVLFFEPLCYTMVGLPVIVRGMVYAVLIFAFEYVTGTLLKKASLCPWDYSGAKYGVNGIIRLDYAPAWFFVGLLFERVCFLLRG